MMLIMSLFFSLLLFAQNSAWAQEPEKIPDLKESLKFYNSYTEEGLVLGIKESLKNRPQEDQEVA